MSLGELRQDLQALLAATAGADDIIPPPVFFVGGADERRVLDDIAAGRVAFRAAGQAARLGAEALNRVQAAETALSEADADDLPEAERLAGEIVAGLSLAAAALDHGRALLTAALAAQVGEKGKARLLTPAKRRAGERPMKPKAAPGKRGRPSTAERDARIAAAVAEAEAEGWRGTAAIARAKRAYPDVFDDLGARGAQAAIGRAKKSATKTPVE